MLRSRIVRASSRGILGVLALAMLVFATTGCMNGRRCSPNGCDSTNWSEYGAILRGQNPCDDCQPKCSPWSEYASILRGCNPCPGGNCGGCAPCNQPCAPCAQPCAPAPCAQPAAPCVRPCAPAPQPCAKPCPTPCAKPCAECPPPCRPCSPEAKPCWRGDTCSKPCAQAPCAQPATSPCAQSAPCAPAPCAPLPCGCKVLIPAVYETITETICVECARCSKVWIPPVSETKYREVCVRPACACEIDKPGVTRVEHICCSDACGCPHTSSREVCIEPPSREVTYQPPLYRTEVYTCEVTPGYWKRIDFPAVYDTVTRKVCKSPERWEWQNSAPVVVAPVAQPSAPPAPVAPPLPAPVSPAPATQAPVPAPVK